MGIAATLAAGWARAEDPPRETVRLQSDIQIPFAFESGSELLVRQLDIDELDLKARGRIRLISLVPLHLEVRLESLRGDPKRILEMVAAWTGGAAWAGDIPDIGEVRATDVILAIGPEGKSLAVATLALPQGSIDGLAFRNESDGRWRATVASLKLARLPELGTLAPNLTGLTGLGAETVTVEGAAGLPRSVEAQALFADGIRIDGPRFELEPVQEGERTEALILGPMRWRWRSQGTRMALQRLWLLARDIPAAAEAIDAALTQAGATDPAFGGEIRTENLMLAGLYSPPPPSPGAEGETSGVGFGTRFGTPMEAHSGGARSGSAPATARGGPGQGESPLSEVSGSGTIALRGARLDITLDPRRWAAAPGRQRLLVEAEAIPLRTGAAGRLTIQEAGATLTLGEGRLLASRVNGRWPFDRENLSFTVSAERFSLSGMQVDGRLGWRPDDWTPLELTVRSMALGTLQTEGRLGPWRRPGGAAGVALDLDHLTIRQNPESAAVESDSPPPTEAQRREAEARPLLVDPPAWEVPLQAHIQKLLYNDWPSLTQVDLQFLPPERNRAPEGNGAREESGAGPRGLQALLRAEFCRLGLGGRLTVDAEGVLALQAETAIRDVGFASLMGCALAMAGASEAPIVVEGRAYGRIRLASQGATLGALKDNAQGDLALTVDQGRILRLSNIHEQLSFFLDMLGLVGLNPTRLRDALAFNQFALRGRVAGREAHFRTVQLTAPGVQVQGEARMDWGTADPVLNLDLKVDSELSPQIDFQRRIVFGAP